MSTDWSGRDDAGERRTDDGDAPPTVTRRSVLGLLAGAVGVGVSSPRARAIETDTGPTVVGFGYGGVPLTDGDVDGDREFEPSTLDDVGGETHALVVSGADGRSTYEFSVSGEVVSGTRLSRWDVFSGQSASGAVWGEGTDEYSFRGDLTDLSVGGDANVFLDGTQIEPADFMEEDASSTTNGSTASPSESFGYGEGGYGGTL